MTNHDHIFHNTLLQHFSNSATSASPLLGKRWVNTTHEGAERGAPETAEALKPAVDINDPNFDNKAFKQEKKEVFGNSLDGSLERLLRQIKIDSRELTTEQINIVKEDFKQGLAETIGTNWASIFGTETKPSLPSEIIRKFEEKIFNIGCKQIGLWHDNTNDTTVFKFNKADGQEILFPQKSIKIEYTPKILREENQVTEKTSLYREEITLSNKNRGEILSQLQAAKQGEILTVKRGFATVNEVAGHKTIWHATKDNQGNYIYSDGPAKGKIAGSAAAPLLNGDKISLQSNEKIATPTEGKLKIDNVDYQILGQENITNSVKYFDLAKSIISRFPQIKETGISLTEYADLLRKAHESTGKTNQLPILLPVENSERKQAQSTQQIEQQRQALASARQEADRAITADLESTRRSALSQGRDMFLENRTLRQDKLEQLVNDPALFRKAWENPAAIPGIAPLIQILRSEPIFQQISRGDANFFRDRIREAISNGNNKQLDIEDIINYIMKGARVPSRAISANGYRGPQEALFNGSNDPEGGETGRKVMADCFLEALGQETKNSAKIVGYESDDIIKIRINHNGNIYVVKLNYDSTGITDHDSNIKIFQADGITPYPDNYGCTQSFDLDNKDLFWKKLPNQEQGAARGKIKAAFENAVCPRLGEEIKYSQSLKTDLRELYRQYFNINGQPKPGTSPETINFFNNIIIGATRFQDAASRLNLDEKVAARDQIEERQIVLEYAKVIDNVSFSNNHETFTNLIASPEKFQKAWLENRIQGQREIMKVIGEEPIFASLRNLPPTELAERFRAAAYNGEKENLDAEDIYNILLKYAPNPKMRFNQGFADKSDFKSLLNRYYDANGSIKSEYQNPKPEDLQNITLCRDFIKGASRMLRIFEMMDISTNGFVTSEPGLNTNILNNSGNKIPSLPSQPGADNFAVYNLEDLIKSVDVNGISGIGLTRAGNLTGTESAGISIDSNITQRMELPADSNALNQGLALKYIFKVFTLEQLINTGCLKKTTNSKGSEFYILTNTPLTADAQYKWIGNEIRNNKLPTQANLEILNPQNRIMGLINQIFPAEGREANMADVTSGQSVAVRGGIERTRTLQFARDTFLNMPGLKDGNGQLLPEEVTRLISGYLKQGLIREFYRLSVDKAEMSGFIFQKKDIKLATGNQKLVEIYNTYFKENKQLSIAEISAILNNPEALKCLRESFGKDHDEKVEQEKKTAVEKAKHSISEWQSKNQTEITQAQQKLADELVKRGYTPEQIERIKVEALPYFFYAGGSSEGAVVGGGANYALNLGKGNTILIGASLFTGTQTGIEGHAAYETGKIGPIRFAVAGGGGANLGREIGVGYGTGAYMPIDLVQLFAPNSESNTGITFTPGLSYIPGLAAIGLPPVVPSATVTFSKNAENRLNEATRTAIKLAGWEEIESASTDQEKIAKIKSNPSIQATLTQYLGKPNPSDQDLLRAYTEQRNDLCNQVVEKLDLGTFDSITFGIGYNPATGKVILGLGASIYIRTEKLNRASGTQDLNLQHQLELARQMEENLTPEMQRNRINTTTFTGVNGDRLKVNDKTGTRTTEAQMTASEANDKTPINNLEALTKDLNEKLKPLNLSVTPITTDKGTMFKLNVMNLNGNTNYEFAVDHAMTQAGVLYENGNIYLTSQFKADDAHRLSIQRADYHFPLAAQNANHFSIISISDNPLRSYMDIYNSAPNLIRWQNGVPNKELVSQFGRPVPGLTDQIHTGRDNIFNTLLFNDRLKQVPPIQNSAAYEADRKLLLETEDKKGKLEPVFLEKDKNGHSRYDNFAIELLRKHPAEYRRLSNDERSIDGSDVNKLNELIKKDWKRQFPQERNPNDTELNYLRNLLIRFTAVENPDQVKPGDKTEQIAAKNRLRKLKFDEHLRNTRETIKTRFKGLIEQYNKQNPQNKISRTAEELADHVIQDLKDRSKNVNVFHPTQMSIDQHLQQIESFEYVAGSQNIRGFRGESYQKDLNPTQNPEYMMLMASKNYADFLTSNPQSWQADLAKVIMNAHSSLPTLPDQPSRPEAVKLLRSTLGFKLQSFLMEKGNHFALMLDRDQTKAIQYRDALIHLSAQQNDTSSLSEIEKQALINFNKIATGIRQAELSGSRSLVNPNNPDYTFTIAKFELHDGVYNVCTNYSSWLNESISLTVRGQSEQYSAVATGQSDATEMVTTTTTMTTNTVAGGVAAAFGGHNGGGGEESPATDDKHQGGSSQGAGDIITDPSKQRGSTDINLTPGDTSPGAKPPAAGGAV